MSVLQLAFSFFIVANPVGNCPTIIALIKDHDLSRQQKILFRESIFSMILAIIFLFVGESFLSYLHIENYALKVSGGILLFVVALKMIFSSANSAQTQAPKQDPFIVPIATPLISGAGLLTMIMVYSQKEANDFKILLAILIAWIGVTAVLVTAPYMQIILGKRGLAALEQLMGMLLAMISIEMIVQGATLFMQTLQTV